jgi:polar amino acid transport system substrate-binding protein
LSAENFSRLKPIMKKKIKFILLLFISIFLASCDKKERSIVLRSEADLSGLRVGVSSGSFFDIYLTPRKDITLHRFMTLSDNLQALLNGKIDVLLESEVLFNSVVQKEQGIKIAMKSPFSFPAGIAFSKKDVELARSCSAVLKEMQADGTMQRIKDFWLSEKYISVDELPAIPPEPKGKPLKVHTCTTMAPISFLVGDKWYGIEVDIVRALAAKLQRPVEFEFIDYSSAILALQTGACDIMMGCIFITEERQQRFQFAESYHAFSGAYYVIDQEAREKGAGFWANVQESLWRNLIVEKRWRFIAHGLWETIKISTLSILLGSLLGVGLLLMTRSRRRWVRAIAGGYNWFVACVPQLVLLLILFYVIFAQSSLSPWVVSVFAFAMTFASAASGIYATSLNAIPPGQTEAGLALGFTRLQTFIYIVFPQAVSRGLPLYKGQCVNLLKGTAIVGYIAIEDLTHAVEIIRSRTFDAFVPLLVITIIYFLLAWLLGKLIELGIPKKHVL